MDTLAFKALGELRPLDYGVVMPMIDERVDSLETKFAAFMAGLDHHIARLDQNIARLDQNLERLDRNYEELKREARQHRLEWAQLAERLGRFAEDIVAPNIPRLGREVFGIPEPEFTAQRVEKRHIKNPSLFREFDLIYAGHAKIIVVETKATARVKYIVTSPTPSVICPGIFRSSSTTPRFPFLPAWP
ncbi:MAG: hypothetical protein FJ403_21550 [Verrucomicrobia bacterium]|nr:hypothetical protein [Verrucomicrobiota bacterium]